MTADLDELGGGLGGGFGIFAGVSKRMAADRAMRENSQRSPAHRLFESLHQVPIGQIQVPITAGAGAYQMADLLSPKAGYMWSVRRITASGYSAGAVSVYKNGAVVAGAIVAGSEPVMAFAAAGVSTAGRGEILLDQNDQLIIVATGITLSAGFAGVQISGAADCFERWLLPEYLG